MKKILVLLCLFFGVAYACASGIDVDYDNGIYHIVLTGNKIQKRMVFVSSPNLITNKEAHLNSGSLMTVNAGFFDPKNQKTISYIVNDSQTVEDPLFNENLMYNPVLRKNLKAITNICFQIGYLTCFCRNRGAVNSFNIFVCCYDRVNFRSQVVQFISVSLQNEVSDFVVLSLNCILVAFSDYLIQVINTVLNLSVVRNDYTLLA